MGITTTTHDRDLDAVWSQPTTQPVTTQPDTLLEAGESATTSHLSSDPHERDSEATYETDQPGLTTAAKSPPKRPAPAPPPT